MSHPDLQGTAAREDCEIRCLATRLAPRAEQGGCSVRHAALDLGQLERWGLVGGPDYCPCLGIDLSRYGYTQVSSRAVRPTCWVDMSMFINVR